MSCLNNSRLHQIYIDCQLLYSYSLEFYMVRCVLGFFNRGLMFYYNIGLIRLFVTPSFIGLLTPLWLLISLQVRFLIVAYNL